VRHSGLGFEAAFPEAPEEGFTQFGQYTLRLRNNEIDFQIGSSPALNGRTLEGMADEWCSFRLPMTDSVSVPPLPGFAHACRVERGDGVGVGMVAVRPGRIIWLFATARGTEASSKIERFIAAFSHTDASAGEVRPGAQGVAVSRVAAVATLPLPVGTADLAETTLDRIYVWCGDDAERCNVEQSPVSDTGAPFRVALVDRDDAPEFARALGDVPGLSGTLRVRDVFGAETEHAVD